jgi:dihydroorotate dehydrogenase
MHGCVLKKQKFEILRLVIFAHQMYKILRSLLFLLPAETAHHFSMNLLKAACSIGFIKNWLSGLFSFRDPKLARTIWGLNFQNPVGLGAGFDKNAKYLNELDVLGFGFVEIGTVTPKPQEGNPRPRLFRLPKDQALINRMGFNNEGVEKVAGRLKIWRERQKTSSRMIIGGNIGKNKNTENEEAWKDYETCFSALHPYVDFFVVNVSSPNTPGLRALQGKEVLKNILVRLQELNGKFPQQKPILLKIAPDLGEPEVNDVLDLAREIMLDGLVVANTTISREGLKTSSLVVEDMGVGGLSGKPLAKKSTRLVQYVHDKTGGQLPVIASGGVFNGRDAVEKIRAGGAMVEVWTGFIYEGPFIVKRICSSFV